jgi:hypothetical protein
MIKHTFLKNFTLLCSIFLVVGCAGRTANPTPTVHIGDSDACCEDLEAMMSEVEAKINHLMPKSEKTGKNVALGVTGAFFIVPLFFMDFSDAEKVEIEAYRSRYNHLVRIYNRKGCGTKEIIKPFGLKEEPKLSSKENSQDKK